MGKKLFIAATVILLLLLFLSGMLEYRQLRSYRIPIHSGLRSIGKVNTDAFIESLVSEYVWGPRKVTSKSSSASATKTRATGISLPGNIFFYNLTGLHASTVFCSLPLSDVTEFISYLQSEFGIRFGDDFVGTGYDGRLTVICSATLAAIAYSRDREDVRPVLTDLIQNRNIAPSTDSLIAELKKDRSHITVISSQGAVNVELSGDRLSIMAEARLPKDFVIPQICQKRVSDTGSYATLYCNMLLPASLFKKSYQVKQFSLDMDSLLPFYRGYADIRFPGITEQTDTVITYAFSDNFEKMANVSVDTTKVPGIDITIASAPGLVPYLQRQQLVLPSQQLNRELFPLYRLDVREAGPLVQLTNMKHGVRQPELVTSETFFEMALDVTKLKPVIDSSELGKYFHGVRSINLAGKKLQGLQVSVQGSVLFESSPLINIIANLESRR